MSLRRDFELWTFKQCRDSDRLWERFCYIDDIMLTSEWFADLESHWRDN